MRICPNEDITRPDVGILNHQLMADSLPDIVEMAALRLGEVAQHPVKVADALVRRG